MKTKLKPFQKKGVRKITHFGGRALLADEMGLGKTLQTLKWLEENPEIRPAVVVCPASLKWVWQHEARLHLKMRSEILEGTKPPKTKAIGKHQIIILNYEILQYWMEWIVELKPQVLIVDECHYIKNSTRIRTKAVKKLGKLIHGVETMLGGLSA